MSKNIELTEEEMDMLLRETVDPIYTERDDAKKPYSQWSVVGDGSYAATVPTVSKLEPGLYEFQWNNQYNSFTFMKQSVNTDELYELPTEEIKEILADIKSFWNKAEEYKKYKLMHKRGILLYGEPGCGKSGIIQLCMKHIINDLSGIVINIKDEDSVKAYIDTIQRFRQIEPNRPLIVIIEDIDSVAGESNYSNSMLLNILDGVKQIENVVYIATTNYPEKLAERITNRPSRFDRRYLVEPPSKEVRRAYLKNKSEGLPIDVEKWVKDTNGMSMSHIKELFISVVLLDIKYEDAISHLNGLKKSPRIKKGGDIGFN
jgi:SpoVK/Ycf46/Vps4 family AAA+-type ATPase